LLKLQRIRLWNRLTNNDRLCLIKRDKVSQIEPDWIYLTTTELEKLIPGATIALGILYLGKPSEKPTDAVSPR
jgi:hypothetical protein